MKFWMSILALFLATSVVAQEAEDGTTSQSEEESANSEDEMDDAEADRILRELEALQLDVEQVNQLGQVEPRDFAIIRFLDRLNAEVKLLAVAKGQEVQEQFIKITLEACFVPANKDLKDAVAYLKIEDIREEVPVFDGWMIASSPALSAMDHARYDVWIDSCSAEMPDLSAVEEAEEVTPASAE